MEKNSKLKNAIANAGKIAKEALDNAVQLADQNDDGKFDLDDVTIIAKATNDGLKKGIQVIKNNADETAKLMELKTLRPIFPHTITSPEFSFPKFIRIIDRDKKYKDSIVCQGSIGHASETKELKYINIFTDSIDSFGLNLYPDAESEFYYIDPSEKGKYIALDDYFNYLKIARVNELQKLAQDLGAKYFRVTYKEEKASFTEKKAKLKVKAKGSATVDGDHEHSEKKFFTVNIAAENTYEEHPPIQPQLKYLEKDPTIQNLINMRLDPNGTIHQQKIMIQLSQTCGMKENDAAKVDAVLKGLKYSGNTTVSIEAQNESRKYFEYDIQF